MRTLSFLLIPCAALMAGQAADPTESKGSVNEKKNTQSVESREIEFSIAVPEKTMAGNRLEVLITVKNRSKEKVGYIEGLSNMKWKVVDVKGNPMPLTRFGHHLFIASDGIGRRRTIFVSPGKSITEAVNLARLFDFSIPGDCVLSITRIVMEATPPRKEIVLTIKDLSFKVVNPLP